MGVYFGETEITNIDNLVPQTMQDITQAFFGSTEIFTVWATYDGALPAQYSANGSLLADYRIYGSAGGVGDNSGTAYGYEVDIGVRSVNLFDVATITANEYLSVATGELIDTPNSNTSAFIEVNPGNTYTITWKKNSALYSSANREILFFNAQKNYTSLYIFFPVMNEQTSFTFTGRENATYIKFDYDKSFVDIMLIESSAAPTEYQPYSNTTTPIYIGSSPLGEDEYIDYESGKIYRKKQVHTDTVTIDGIVWDILGYDHDTVYKSDNTLAQHSVTIQAHDVLSDMQFDAKEALFSFDNGLSAGTYHFTVGAQPWYSGDVGKTIQFTLSSALPVGGQLVVNNAYNATMVGATISAFASGTATTATEIVTMSEGSDGTDLGTVSNGLSQDGVINSVQRALFGSNNWSESCIRQYLNSSASAGSVWEPKNKWDRPPSWAAYTAGFLNGMSAEFIAALGAASKTTALSNVTDGGGVGATLDKVFLLSRSEAYTGDEVTGGEGTAYPYYSEYSDLPSPGTGTDVNRIKKLNGTAKYWYLRSPDVGSANTVRLILATGALNYNLASSSFGVSPACCIPLDDIDTNDWLREKFLKPVDPPVPLPALPTVDGTTITDYAGQSAAVPSQFYAKYRKEGF